MAQGKRVSLDIGAEALQSIKDLGAAAKQARLQAGEGQAAAAAKLGVHVQTIGRIEAGEPGVAVGHVMGMLALYGIAVQPHAAAAAAGSATEQEQTPVRAD
nr:helix-turn-helix domain-containing protein [uncultured Roseateles sp.]